jgi:hypothetical protein
MILTNKHIDYEDCIRQIFIGKIIRAVIYGEVKYQLNNEGGQINPVPYYKTKYADIDTLDHSVYLKTDNKAIYVFWDNTFISYGLKAEQIDLTNEVNDYEQKWDVSSDDKWIAFIRYMITDFKVLWEKSRASNTDGSNEVFTIYPQAFEIKVDNDKYIVISASDLVQSGETKVNPLMDNLLVTTNLDLARQLKIVE